MKTYQDLLHAGSSEKARGTFCEHAVEEFRGTTDYKNAVAGEAYYNKHNLTIEQFQKFLYTVSGTKKPDLFSANYKLKTLFFRRFVQQQVQYVLGNGLTLQNPDNKKKLGRDFDFQLVRIAKRAMASGRAFGFWNLDHLEVFGYADTPNDAGFCPLYSEVDAKLCAGVRFWYKRIGSDIITRYTLYEADGYTEYKQFNSEEVTVLEPKRNYKQIVKKTAVDGIVEKQGENYTELPIVCLYVNDSRESELVGIRESIDCYDYIKSGLANDIDDASGFYWLIKNTGGMEDADLAQFMQRLKTVRAASLEGDDGVEAEAHTLEVPIEARSRMLEILRTDMYEDFQSLDVKTLSAAAKTTQEIQAAYQSQDNKCADFEYYMLSFVGKIMTLAGVEDEPSFVWNRVVNQLEQTNMILSAANYLTPNIIIKKLPFLTPEEADMVIKELGDEDFNRFNDNDENVNEE